MYEELKNINKQYTLPPYYSPRISSELPDCSSPLTFDCYSRCSMSCRYCVPKGSGITMVDGSIKEVQDVMVGDVLLGYNENTQKPEATTVLQCMNHKEHMYATFKVENKMKFSTTLNHPIFTKEEGWIDARYVKKGMHVLRHNTFIKKRVDSKHIELIFHRRIPKGTSKHTLFAVWNQMVQRCHNPNAHNFKYYGLRGIQVCEQWRYDPRFFYAWSETNGYTHGLEIDRIDNDGEYEPSNCQWVSHRENSGKRSRSGKCNSLYYVGIRQNKNGFTISTERNAANTYKTQAQAAIIYDRKIHTSNFIRIPFAHFEWTKIVYIRTHFKNVDVYNFECWPNNDYCTQIRKSSTSKFMHGIVVSNCFSHAQKDVNPGTKTAPLQAVHPDKFFKMMDGESHKKEDVLFYKYFFKNKFLLHLGGLADSFCHYEKKYGYSYPIIKGVLERKYPLMFSSKGPMITDKKYISLFEKHAKNNTTAFQFSIVTADDALAKKVEPGVPSPTIRFENMKILSDMGYQCILRLRPFIIGVTDETLPELLQKAYESGAKAISTEFYAVDQRCVGSMRKATEKMGNLMGIDNIFSYFTTLSPKERGGYCRLNRLIKEPYIKFMYKFCLEHGMLFTCSDPDFKELSGSQNCCFIGNTEILIKKEASPFVFKTTLKSIHDTYNKFGTPFKVMSNGKWYPCVATRVPYRNKSWYKITLRNGIEYTTTQDHINLTNTGEILSKDLKVGTFIRVVDSPMKQSPKRGNYDTGWFIGIYLAEGSNALDKDAKVILTINKRDPSVYTKIKTFIRNLGGYVPASEKNDRESHWWMQCKSTTVSELIREFTAGKKAPKKRLRKVCLAMSNEFKRGLFDGWMTGDTGNSSSKQLIEDMRDIAVTLGYKVNLHSYIRKNKVYNETHDTIYTLGIVKFNNKSKIDSGSSYDSSKIYRRTVHNIDDKYYAQIISIDKFKEGRKRYAYCLEVPKVHTFQLTNGLLTHNCGLPPKGYHPTKVLNNWSTHQLTAYIMEARIAYHKTGKCNLFKFDDVYGEPDWILDDIHLSHMDIGCTKYPYAMRKQLTLRHLLQEKWNNLKSYANPSRYFHGKILPVGLDETKHNLVYRYNPNEYEERWVDEGIDLSYDWRDDHKKYHTINRWGLNEKAINKM